MNDRELRHNPRPRRQLSAAKRLATIMAMTSVAVTTACGSDTTKATEASANDTFQTVDPATATKLKLGDTLQVVADLPQELDGDPVHFSSFASNGEVLGHVTPRDTDPGKQGPSAQSRPVIYNLEARKFTVLDDRARPQPTWVADVVGNEQAVVWVEGLDYNIAHSTFTIYAYDRLTHKVATIGEFDDRSGQIAYGNDLSIRDATAYFSTATFPTKKGQESVYAMPVDGSTAPLVLVAGAEQVRIDGNTLRYWVRNPNDETEYPKHFTYDLTTGMTTPVPVNAHAGENGFCGAEVTDAWEMWCTGHTMRPGPEKRRNQALLTIKEASGRTTEFKPFPVGSLNSPIPHNVVSFGRWTGISVPTDDGQQREFLVDLDTKEVEVFPNNTSFDDTSPDRTMVLVSSFGGDHGRQRIVQVPTS